MDLLETLRFKIDSLEEGEYSPGLKAVLLHIGTAFRHLSRGQGQGDDTAFTDAVYRTNQAFEGSIKEAYRVLAGKQPDNVRPFDIENYLEKENIFRPRVLTQFTNYRREWRNPSTHDYKLDFDESEAFLAIISVSAFACLLLDQVAERLSYAKSKKQADESRAIIEDRIAAPGGDLLERVVDLLKEFARLRLEVGVTVPRVTEVQLLGALSGFFSSAAPEFEIATGSRLGTSQARPDVVVTGEGTKIVIEVKASKFSNEVMYAGIAQLERYMQIGDFKLGILFFYPAGEDLEVIEPPVRFLGSRILILRAKKAPNPEPQADVAA